MGRHPARVVLTSATLLALVAPRPSAAQAGTQAATRAAAPAPAAVQAQHRAILRSKLRRALVQVADSFPGVLGVETIDLADGSRVGVNDTLVFPQGSAIKVPILLELFRRAESRPGYLRERRAVPAAAHVGGSGVLTYFGDGGSELALEDLAVLMIALSDNTAANVLIDELGPGAVNETVARLGLTRTRLQRKMMRPELSARGDENVSTPAEAAALMARVARCDLPVSAAACARLRAILEIPKEGDAVRAVVPDSIKVASKPGDLEGVGTVWALVDLPDRPYVVTIMATYGAGDVGATLRRVAALTHEHFASLARATAYGVRVPPSALRERPPTP
jgi:beta-lactamase class A